MTWIRTRWGVGLAATTAAAIVGLGVATAAFASSGPVTPAGVIAGSSGTTPSGSTGTVTSTTTPSASPTVTVSATGTANGTPDTVTINIGASTTASSASDALSQNNNEMNRLEAILTAAGATPSDLTTSGLSLSPNYGSSDTINGYEADDSLTVTLHNVASAGAVIDAAAGAVGNDVRLDGISFSVSDTSGLLKQARTEAMQVAATEAANLASGAGDTLGPVESITDNEQDTTPPLPVFARAAGAAPSSPVPLQAGSEAVSVNVQVVYTLVPPTS